MPNSGALRLYVVHREPVGRFVEDRSSNNGWLWGSQAGPNTSPRTRLADFTPETSIGGSHQRSVRALRSAPDFKSEIWTALSSER
jgi:hypothetical protein